MDSYATYISRLQAAQQEVSWLSLLHLCGYLIVFALLDKSAGEGAIAILKRRTNEIKSA
jgi:hypothetical protein